MFNIILLPLVAFVILYWYATRNFDYWKKRGVKHERPVPFFGNNLKQFLQKASYAMVATETYRKFPEEKIVGFFRGGQPELVIRDPEIIKRILITDFNQFYPRGLNTHKHVVEPMLKNLFFADGDLWKLLRQRISPAFSTSKLKKMFYFITERAEKLQMIAEKVAERGEILDAKEIMARYTTDFIGACGFGINMDTLNNDNTIFRKLGARIFTRTLYDALRGALKQIFPEMCKHVHFLDADIENTMVQLVQAVVADRNYKPSGRNDFIDLMLEVKLKGNMIGESIEKVKPDGTPEIVDISFDDMLLTAQIFVLFGAGFETSSSTSSFTLHQLAYHPEWQEQVQNEIDRVLARHNNQITYEAVNEMALLEMVFYEAMRMYPSVGFLIRKCAARKYTIPEVNVTIDEGVSVIIPVQALHNDEQYFKDPGTFNPMRFSPEAKRNLTKYVYMPFGEGPRACVGARLGLMQSMAGLVAVLQKFTVAPAPSSKPVPIPDPTAIVAEGIIGGLPLLIKKRKLYS